MIGNCKEQFLRDCKEINFRLSRRINFSARDEGARRSGATPSDDNEAQENLDKRELKFIDEQFLGIKEIFAALSVAFVLGNSCVGLAGERANPYVDLPKNHAAYQSIIRLTDEGILSPYDDGTFDGQRRATRYCMAAIFANLCDKAKLPATELEQDYVDVKTDGAYRNSVKIVTKCGIMSGYGDKTFRGDNPITRFDLAMMIAKFMRAANIADDADSSPMQFSDVPPDHWAYANVALTVHNEVMAGFADGTFRGYQPITRYEVALIIDKLNGYCRKKT